MVATFPKFLTVFLYTCCWEFLDYFLVLPKVLGFRLGATLRVRSHSKACAFFAPKLWVLLFIQNVGFLISFQNFEFGFRLKILGFKISPKFRISEIATFRAGVFQFCCKQVQSPMWTWGACRLKCPRQRPCRTQHGGSVLTRPDVGSCAGTGSGRDAVMVTGGRPGLAHRWEPVPMWKCMSTWGVGAWIKVWAHAEM